MKHSDLLWQDVECWCGSPSVVNEAFPENCPKASVHSKTRRGTVQKNCFLFGHSAPRTASSSIDTCC